MIATTRHITVTEKHVQAARLLISANDELRTCQDPISLALTQQTEGQWWENDGIVYGDQGQERPLPAVAVDFLAAFYDGQDVQPIEFDFDYSTPWPQD